MRMQHRNSRNRVRNARLRLEALEAREVPALIGGLDPSFSPNAPAGVTDGIANHKFNDVAFQSDGKIIAVGSNFAGDNFIAYRFNVDGSPDISFGTNGSMSVDVGGRNLRDGVSAVAVDSQDRIVMVGTTGFPIKTDFGVVRLSSNGQTVDVNRNFHVGNASDNSFATDVAFQTDGTIVVVGNAMVGSDRDMVLVRLQPDNGATIGSPLTIDFPVAGDNDRALGVAVYQSGPNP